MSKYLIRNATIINEGKTFKGDLLTDGQIIRNISETGKIKLDDATIIDGRGKILIPGIIDDHVHFREPGLTQKGDISTESSAAVAGGVTSWMDMPNTIPQTVTIDELNRKYETASLKSHANYAFYLGATNSNIGEVKKADPSTTCGVKVFMGSSTGNMLADNKLSLEKIFAECPVPVATHCEDEETILKKLEIYKDNYGENIPVQFHPMIRNEEACFKSTSTAVELAQRFGTKLHVLHISTARELSLFEKGPAAGKRITAEACIHHLIYNSEDYLKKGSLIKLNPAIKKETDRTALFQALKDDKLDVIATDHSPHTFAEKLRPYLSCPSGAPMIQHSLVVMLEFWKNGMITLEEIVSKMCHAPAEIFGISKRGFLKEGYYADLVLVDPQFSWVINKSNILYKCGWSSLEDQTMSTWVDTTFVNGEIAYSNGKVIPEIHSLPLRFER